MRGRVGCVHCPDYLGVSDADRAAVQQVHAAQRRSAQERTEALLERCGFSSRGVFVMDGSRRSVHGNAYFTGVGRNKRIVFFDTLLERLQIAEVEAVLAHELGHFRLHHVRSRLLLSLAFGLARSRSTRRAHAVAGFLSRASASRRPRPMLHCCCSCSCCPSSRISRRRSLHGGHASTSSRPTSSRAKFADARQLAAALVKLYRDNATTLTPDSLHSAFYDSHPPALVRISRLQQLAART